MAFLNPLEEEKEKQQAGQINQIKTPNFTGGQLVEASTAPSAGPPKSDFGAPTTSGRWINISDYLQANPSIGKTAEEKGNKLTTEEQGIYDKAADSLRRGEQGPGVRSYDLTNKNILNSLTGGQAPFNVEDLRKQLTNKYSGPEKVDYDPTKSGNVAKVKKLSDINTATDVLAEDEIKKGAYGLGLRNLDTSLLGADATYGQAAPKLWNNISDFLTKSGKETTELNLRGDAYKNGYNASANKVKGALQDLKEDIPDKLRKLQQETAQQKESDLNKYLQDYTTWYKEKYLPVVSKSGWGPGAEKDAPIDPERKNAKRSNQPPLPPDIDNNFLFKYGPIQTFDNPTINNVGSDSDYLALKNIDYILGTGDAISQQGHYRKPEYDLSEWAKAAQPLGQHPGNARLLKEFNEASKKEWERVHSNPIETPEELAKRLGIILS